MPPGKACVIWFTGIPCSGKTTLAEGLCAKLHERGVEVEHLDGDKVRAALSQTVFTKEARDEHIRRIGFMASRLEAHGIFVIASFVSPYKEARNFARNLCRNFLEIYVYAPMDICEKRDTKGLYKKAREGSILDLTGLQDPYEPPAKAELTIDTSKFSIDESLEKVMTLAEPFLK